MIIKVPCLLPGVSTDTIARIMTKPSTNPKPKTGAEKYDTCIHSYVDEMMSNSKYLRQHFLFYSFLYFFVWMLIIMNLLKSDFEKYIKFFVVV